MMEFRLKKCSFIILFYKNKRNEDEKKSQNI